MDDIAAKYSSLYEKVEAACGQIGLADLQSEATAIEAETLKPEFWQDNQKASSTNQKLAKLKSRIGPWQLLKTQVADGLELAKIADSEMSAELTASFDKYQKKYNSLEHELKFSGEYDDHDVILSIYAGAGGTDAQDWAAMMMRMYLRWVESHPGMSSTIVEQSDGEEAGIKSITIEIDGSLAYGKLRGEAGVHRLVRLSPFNSDNLRQTSFAKLEVMPKIDQPNEVEIDEKDVKVDVYRAGGHGGQSVNTTDSAVRVTHMPTGIVVAIQNERSQLQNKETAMTILRSKLAQLQIDQHKEKISELKGPNEQAAWGNQIRSYVLHPYSMVKDLRTRHETNDTGGVLDGKIDDFINAYLEYSLNQK